MQLAIYWPATTIAGVMPTAQGITLWPLADPSQSRSLGVSDINGLWGVVLPADLASDVYGYKIDYCNQATPDKVAYTTQGHLQVASSNTVGSTALVVTALDEHRIDRLKWAVRRG